MLLLQKSTYFSTISTISTEFYMKNHQDTKNQEGGGELKYGVLVLQKSHHYSHLGHRTPQNALDTYGSNKYGMGIEARVEDTGKIIKSVLKVKLGNEKSDPFIVIMLNYRYYYNPEVNFVKRGAKEKK